MELVDSDARSDLGGLWLGPQVSLSLMRHVTML